MVPLMYNQAGKAIILVFIIMCKSEGNEDLRGFTDLYLNTVDANGRSGVTGMGMKRNITNCLINITKFLKIYVLGLPILKNMW